MMLLLLVEYTAAFVTWFLVRMSPYWLRAAPFVKTLLFLLMQLIISFWTSVFIYIAFYLIYVPDAVYETPIHFTFDTACKLSGQSIAGGACSFPTANLSLRSPTGMKHFAYGQTYKVFVELDLPDSEVNAQLGMFIVAVDFYSVAGAITQSSRRATMLQYRSPLLTTIDTLVRWPLFVFGSEVQRQTLRLEMLSAFVDNPYKSTAGAVVQLQNPMVQLYSARLMAYAQFSGIKHWLFYHPFISAFVGFGMLFLIWNFFMFVVFLRRVVHHVEEKVEEEPPTEEWPDPKPTLIRRGSLVPPENLSDPVPVSDHSNDSRGELRHRATAATDS